MSWSPRRTVEALIVLLVTAGSAAVAWAAVQVLLSPAHGPAVLVGP